MIRLQTHDGCFVHPHTNEPLRSIEVVIVDEGALSRNYYKDNNLVCWSTGCDFPDTNVLNKQAKRCMDCTHSIKAVGNTGAAPCKFFTRIKVAFLGQELLYELRLNSLSLFSKAENKMSLYKYKAHLERNQEKIGSVLTSIYFVKYKQFYKMYFKPVRPLYEEELESIRQLKHEETYMANYEQYIIRNVTVLHPRIDQTYIWDDDKGRSVPCDPSTPDAIYRTDFIMSEEVAKELWDAMVEAYEDHVTTLKAGGESGWPEEFEFPFVEQEDGTFRHKAKKKGMYRNGLATPPIHYDAELNELEGFKLTHESVVNLAVGFVPYKLAGGGVSLRLDFVQVLEQKPARKRNPFQKEKGFVKSDDSSVDTEDKVVPIESKKTKANPFGKKAEAVEEVKEPVKRKNKQEVDESDEDIEDIISTWSSKG